MISLIDPQIWASFLTLTALELVLGIDNLVFISILASRLPQNQQALARRLGLALALITRLILLAFIGQLAALTQPLFEIAGHAFTIRDLVFISGGLFLIYKGTKEIHAKLEGEGHNERTTLKSGFISIVFQMVLFDLVFSLDSVITAIGMANEYVIMAAAILISVIVMLAASDALSRFINKHPTVKMLALSFLLLIGMTLIADGWGVHVPKGYIYAAISFSIIVETLNQLMMHRRRN